MTTKLSRKPNDPPVRPYKQGAVLPVDLTEACFQRLETLIRQVCRETFKNLLIDQGMEQQEAIRQAVSAPSLLPSANMMLEEDAEEESEDPPSESQPVPPRPRRTYGSHVQEVVDGKWVNV